MWHCKLCKSDHKNLPLCYGAEAPWRQFVPDGVSNGKVELSDDLCVVDGKIFLIRGHIEIPIIGRPEFFAWSVWCSLSEQSFSKCVARWSNPERVNDGYFGWLITELSVYPDTANLKVDVCSRELGVVPYIRIQECAHPLYHEQTNGITWEQVEYFAHQLLHPQ